MTPATLAAQRRLIVCVGPGGVGKTTVAAALALDQAVSGRRVLVLTIDPARRLADALGLNGLGDEIREAPLDSLTEQGIEVRGTLHAAMFDNAEAMDALMVRVAPDAETRDSILRNRVYRAMAGSLSRSHAYLAMERLYEVMHAGRWDLVVLDTPPARNALDILDAPGRLASFLEDSVMKWFMPPESGGGLRQRIVSRGSEAATKMLGLVLGRDFLDETLAFFRVFYRLRDGFRTRATEVQAMFREPETAFVLVSSVDETHLDDARALGRGLTDRGVAPEAVVFNRAYERLSEDPSLLITSVLVPRIDNPSLSPEASPKERAMLADAVAGLVERAASDNRAAHERTRALDGVLAEDCVRAVIPRADADIRDLVGLHTLAHHLREPVRVE